MKKTHVLFQIVSPRALACAVAAAALALGCGAERSDDSVARSAPEASSAEDFTYDSLIDLLGNPDGFERARVLAERLPKLGPRSLAPVKMVLKQVSTAEIELAAADYELLMRFWAQHDPEGASNYAYGASPRGYRVGAIYATVRQWMKVDPLGALEKVRPWTRQEGDFGTATQVALMRGWYDSGKEGIDQYLRDMGSGFERQRAVSTYLVSMAHDKGGDAVAKWAVAQMEHPDKSFRLDVFRGAGDALIAIDVKAAQRFCDAHCDAPHGQNMRTAIATRWVEVGEPPEVFAWLEKAPRNEETDLAVRRSFAIWADLDRPAAVAWMKPRIAEESNAWLLPALPIYVRLYGRMDPQDVLGIIPSFFPQAEERDFWTVETLRYWRQKDESAAEKWMAQASLSPEILAKVREPQTEYERLIMKQEDEKIRVDKIRASLDTAAAR